jgi:putative DNA primase/helicase
MPNAQCPTWLTFLENSFPDREVRDFLQRFLGYMLEGTGKEKVAAFFHGYGDNGKTMLMAVLTAIFGFKSDNAYGKAVAWETFAENKGGAIRNDLARLHNARAVFCDESEQGMVLKEAMFKSVTGASPITARFLHKEHFTFVSKFVFVLTTNRLPSVKGGDGASWSRILKVPMTQSFPVGHPKRIEGLKALLMAEREGIAAWMVEGYRKYKADGLKVPQVIKDASAEYRENSDVIESFLTECTENSKDGWVAFEAVYSRYSRWCMSNHEKEQAKDSFIDNLKARGYDVRRKMNLSGRPRFVYGFRLLPENGM